jgi:hypothetical protein
MCLAIASIATCLPGPQQHASLLGNLIAGACIHLYEPAGAYSCPPTVPRGATRIDSAPYTAPTAPGPVRTSDLASDAVARALSRVPGCAERVEAVLHTHCTLDQQILGSACLRIEHDHFRRAGTSISVGQLGTAGIPTTLLLAARATAAAGAALACVSASDKWLAPMYRRRPGLVTYGDAGAACLVGAAGRVADPLAEIESIHTVCRPPAASLWSAAPEEQRACLLELAAAAIEGLLGRRRDVDRARLALCGDGYGDAFACALQERCGLGGPRLAAGDGDIHLSSAAPLFALERVIEAAASQAQPLRAVVWTATPAGHAGAMLVSACPHVTLPAGIRPPEQEKTQVRETVPA